MNIMLVILGFQVGASYYALPEPLVMPGFTSREACAVVAKELEAELAPRYTYAVVQEPRMRWRCARAS